MAKAQKIPVAQTTVPTQPANKKTAGTDKTKSGYMKLAFLLGIIAFLVYANTMKNDYALDDFTVIKNNSIVTKGISAIPEIFATPYRRGWFITGNDLYRPMSLAMFATEWSLFNGDPQGGHFMNVLIFAGCVMLLFLFLDALFDRKKTAVAFIAALLFALHPIHTEVVANIKSRDELLCFFFAFLSLNVFLKYTKTENIKDLLLGGLFFLLSFFSKETVITMLFVVPFIFFFYKKENRKLSINITIAATIAAVLFLSVRYAVLSHYGANVNSYVSFIDNFLTKPPSAMSRFATEILILGKYAMLLFVPYPLVCDYSYNSIPFVTFGNVGVLVSFVLYIFMAAFGVLRLMKNNKDPFAFGIIFFLVTISLFSNIPFLIGAAMAERFLFFASVGFCLIVALLIEKFLLGTSEAGSGSLTNVKVLAVIVPICIAYTAITVNRNTDWFDNITLFRADVTKAPNDSRLTYYAGTELVVTVSKAEQNPVVSRQYIDEGIKYLRQSIGSYEEYTDAHASLGDAYFRIEQFDSAEVHGKRALQINPKYALAINNLAGVYFMKNDFVKAMDMCKQALVVNPGYINAYSNMGLCYMKLGKYDSSIQSLYKAMAIDPNFTGSYDNIILTFRAMGKTDSVNKYSAILANINSPH